MINPHQISGWVCYASVFFALLGPGCALAESQKGNDKVMVAKGKEVSLEYTLPLEGKKVIASNVGKSPLTYAQ